MAINVLHRVATVTIVSGEATTDARGNKTSLLNHESPFYFPLSTPCRGEQETGSQDEGQRSREPERGKKEDKRG